MLVLHDVLRLALLKWTVFLFVHSSSQLPLPDGSCDGESPSRTDSLPGCERLLGTRCGFWKQLQDEPGWTFTCCKDGHVAGVCRCIQERLPSNYTHIESYETQIVCTSNTTDFPSKASSVTLAVNERRVSTNASLLQANQTEIYEQSLSASDKVDSNFSPLDLETHNTSQNVTFVSGGDGNSNSHGVPSQLGVLAVQDDVLTPESDSNKTNIAHTLSSPAGSKQSNNSAIKDGPPTYSDPFDLNRTESTTWLSGLSKRRNEDKVNLSYRVHSPEEGHSTQQKTSQHQADISLPPIEDRPLFPTWAIALLAFIAVLMLLAVILYLYN